MTKKPSAADRLRAELRRALRQSPERSFKQSVEQQIKEYHNWDSDDRSLAPGR